MHQRCRTDWPSTATSVVNWRNQAITLRTPSTSDMRIFRQLRLVSYSLRFRTIGLLFFPQSLPLMVESACRHAHGVQLVGQGD
jgi:hypothetical protein